MFTLVTVVFVRLSSPLDDNQLTRQQLPLSFMSSFLAIQIDIFPKNEESGEVDWPFGEVSAYLCTSPLPSHPPAPCI